MEPTELEMEAHAAVIGGLLVIGSIILIIILAIILYFVLR